MFSCLSCFCFLEGCEIAEQRRDQLQTQVSDSVGAHLKLVKDGHKPKRTDKKISEVPVEVNESQAKKICLKNENNKNPTSDENCGKKTCPRYFEERKDSC